MQYFPGLQIDESVTYKRQFIVIGTIQIFPQPQTGKTKAPERGHLLWDVTDTIFDVFYVTFYTTLTPIFDFSKTVRKRIEESSEERNFSDVVGCIFARKCSGMEWYKLQRWFTRS